MDIATQLKNQPLFGTIKISNKKQRELIVELLMNYGMLMQEFKTVHLSILNVLP